MALRRVGTKPSSEPLMACVTDTYVSFALHEVMTLAY